MSPSRISKRRPDALRLVAEGYTNGAIADELRTSEQVVKNLLRDTYDKLGLNAENGKKNLRVLAVHWWREVGMLLPVWEGRKPGRPTVA